MSNAPQRRNRRPKSRYGIQLEEKQNLKSIYGIRDRQLKIYYEQAQKLTGETGPQLLKTLESRLDNAIYRAGLAETRKQARQMVSHGFFKVNGRPVNIPSIKLGVKDKVTVKKSKQNKYYFTNFEKRMQNVQVPDWILLDVENYGFTIAAQPTYDETTIGVSVQEIVELLAR